MKAAEGPASFPFEAAMGFAFGLLRLSPDAFWCMSPREFLAALEARGALRGLVSAPDRTVLEDLMLRFPDHNRSAP